MAAIGEKNDHMIVALDHRVVVSDDNFFASHNCPNGGAFRQGNVRNAAADNSSFALHTMCNCFDRFGGAAAQRVHTDHIATSNMGQQLTDGDCLRRECDIDGPALHEFRVCRTIDQGHHLAAA
jgi:hypothetical protein